MKMITNIFIMICRKLVIAGSYIDRKKLEKEGFSWSEKP